MKLLKFLYHVNLCFCALQIILGFLLYSSGSYFLAFLLVTAAYFNWLSAGRCKKVIDYENSKNSSV